MKTSPRFACLWAVTLATTLTACGKSEPRPQAAAPSKPALESMIKVPPSVVSSASVAAPADDGNTYREQGTVRVDAGQGVLQLRSVATIIDPKLGEKTAARLGSASGQKKLADATAGAPQVTAADIQSTADQFAGRTVYSSQAMHAQIINGYSIELDAKAQEKGGPRMRVNLVVSDKDLSLQSAKLEYVPDASSLMQSYVKKIPVTDITITKLERKDEKTFVIAGSFKATDLPPGVLAKELKGKTLAAVQGQFDFTEVPIRNMGL